MNYCEQLGPGKCTPLKLDSIKHQMGWTSQCVYNYGQWAKGIFVGRDNVYVDGKLYDCPAPCLGISITTGDRCGTTSSRSTRRRSRSRSAAPRST